MRITKSTVKSNMSQDILSDSYRYKTGLGIISLLHPCKSTFNLYEIYSIEGNLFDDIERFKTIEEAEKRIRFLLNGIENIVKKELAFYFKKKKKYDMTPFDLLQLFTTLREKWGVFESYIDFTEETVNRGTEHEYTYVEAILEIDSKEGLMYLAMENIGWLSQEKEEAEKEVVALVDRINRKIHLGLSLT